MTDSLSGFFCNIFYHFCQFLIFAGYPLLFLLDNQIQYFSLAQRLLLNKGRSLKRKRFKLFEYLLKKSVTYNILYIMKLIVSLIL